MEELMGTLSHVIGRLLLPALALLVGLYSVRKGWRSVRATRPMPLDWYDRWWVLQARLLRGSDAADRLRATLADVATVVSLTALYCTRHRRLACTTHSRLMCARRDRPVCTTHSRPICTTDDRPMCTTHRRPVCTMVARRRVRG